MVRNRYLIAGVRGDPIKVKGTENNEDPEVMGLRIQGRNVKEQGNNATNKSLQGDGAEFPWDGFTGVATHSRTFLGEAWSTLQQIKEQISAGNDIMDLGS